MAGQPGRDIAVVDAHPCAEAAPGRAGIGGFGQQQIQRAACSISLMLGRARHCRSSAACTARPVASAAWAMRRAPWPPSRVRCSERPSSSRVKGTPSPSSQSIAAGPAPGCGARRRGAQPGAGDQRVLDVRLDAVVRRLRRRDAALRPGAGAIVRRALAQHGHAQMRRQRQGGGHAGQAGADDEHVCRFRMHGPVLRPGRSGGTARRRARSRRCCAPAGEPRRRNPACVRWAGARPARWPDPA